MAEDDLASRAMRRVLGTAVATILCISISLLGVTPAGARAARTVNVWNGASWSTAPHSHGIGYVGVKGTTCAATHCALQ